MLIHKQPDLKKKKKDFLLFIPFVHITTWHFFQVGLALNKANLEYVSNLKKHVQYIVFLFSKSVLLLLVKSVCYSKIKKNNWLKAYIF